MADDSELDDDLHVQIQQLCAEGDELMEAQKVAGAIDRYREAFNLLPEHVDQWEATTWVLAALGDAYFLLKRFTDARDALQEAMHCPDAIGNPFLHLRLGQLQLELGNKERAKDELARAVIIDPSVFEGEDPKYLKFIRLFVQGLN